MGVEDDGASPGASWSGTPPADPAEIGEACNEWVHCVDGAFCDLGADQIPACTTLGVCVAIPEACDDDSGPVCGCDGVLYESACAAAMAGVGTSGAVGCAPPAGTFACGHDFCERLTEYCEYVIPHGQSAAWRCLPLQCSEGASGCACITDPDPCGDPLLYYAQVCEPDDEGNPWLLCVPP